MTTSPVAPGAEVAQLLVPMRVERVSAASVSGVPVLLERLRDVSLLRSSLQDQLEEVHAARVSLTK